MKDYPPNQNPRNDSHPFDGDVPASPWFLNGVPEPHKHHHRHDELVDRCADHCDDQLPLFSQVGRGLRGDGYIVECHDIDECTTKLEGFKYDAATNEYTSEWLSQNLNGGHLSYLYHLRPYGEPPTFTITFKYDRPEHPSQEWEWTTPAIPYVLDKGSGIGNLFIKPTTGATWAAVRSAVASSELPDSIADTLAAYEKLVFPEDETRDVLQPPLPGDDWTVNLTYGKGGDIDCPTTDQVAADIKDLSDHIHEDMGFGDLLINDGDNDTKSPKRNTIKKWLDWIIDRLGFGDNISYGNNLTVKQYIDRADAGVEEACKEYTDNGIATAKTAIETHLHKDLFGGTSGTGSDWADIPSSLKPLMGDTNGQATVWDWIKYAISTAAADATTKANAALADALSHLHSDLGYGDSDAWPDGLKGDGAASGKNTVWKWISWLNSKINGITDPIMYTQEVPVVFVLYELPTAASAEGLPAGTLGITDSTISPAPVYGTVESTTVSNSTIAGKLEISYYDVLPDIYITFDFNIDRGGKIPVIFSKPGHLIIACTNNGTAENPQYVPLNLAAVNLTHRTGTVKKPVFYAENLSNSGYYADDHQGVGHEGMFSVYTGIGNVAATSRNWDNNCRDWPWTTATPGNSGHFYAYLFDRYGGGSTDRILQIDGFRNYDIKFTQATKG